MRQIFQTIASCQKLHLALFGEIIALIRNWDCIFCKAWSILRFPSKPNLLIIWPTTTGHFLSKGKISFSASLNGMRELMRLGENVPSLRNNLQSTWEILTNVKSSQFGHLSKYCLLVPLSHFIPIWKICQSWNKLAESMDCNQIFYAHGLGIFLSSGIFVLTMADYGTGDL